MSDEARVAFPAACSPPNSTCRNLSCSETCSALACHGFGKRINCEVSLGLLQQELKRLVPAECVTFWTRHMVTTKSV